LLFLQLGSCADLVHSLFRLSPGVLKTLLTGNAVPVPLSWVAQRFQRCDLALATRGL
jgi:hypothetical protein